jgi:ATP-dependent RNA helicase RhlE
MQFNQFEILAQIQKALVEEGYAEATPIQAQAIGPLLEGKDLLGCAQTGTGKTAAFAIPILQHLHKNRNEKGIRPIKALVLAPTRELAIQIHESFETYGKHLGLRSTPIYGGVPQTKQTKALSTGVDILVATPGRLLDLINQRYIRLDRLTHFVLDEADQMLDMGMLQDVRKILTYVPTVRQTMFFSATMPPAIMSLADTMLKDPVKVVVTPIASTVDTIRQQLYFVDRGNKTNLLIELLKTEDIESVLVFSRTKHGADKIVKSLEKARIPSLAIHGNKSQNARQAALKSFKDRKTKILVATDIAARGLDIDNLSHVIIYDLPEVPEIYVHRIGRTGRAGLGGTAMTFCDDEEYGLLKDVQKLIKKTIPVIKNHPFAIPEPVDVTYKPPLPKKKGRPQNHIFAPKQEFGIEPTKHHWHKDKPEHKSPSTSYPKQSGGQRSEQKPSYRKTTSNQDK